jgi:predicted DNA-binding WGR domain protein
MRTFRHDESGKFWNLDLTGNTFTVTSGKVGQRGRARTEAFSDATTAKVAADRLIARKLREGFEETTPSARPTTVRAGLEAALVDDPADRAAHAA